MNDQRKTKAQLIQELNDLRHRLASADGSDSPNVKAGIPFDPARDIALRDKGQEQLDILMRIPAARRFPIILVAGFGLLVTGIMVYSLLAGSRIAVRYAPLVDAAMEIKLEATLGHLWFEEIISGDRHKDIAVVWEHLDQSAWFARAMLEGGENPEGVFIPLRDPVLRGEIEDVLANISDFRTIAEERLAADRSGIGTDIDQRFDAVFEGFLKQADKVESVLRGAMARDLSRFRILQSSLIALSLVLFTFVGIIFRRYERRRTLDLLALWQSEQWLNTTLRSIGDAVITTDAQGKVSLMNPVAEGLTGWNEAQAMGKPLENSFNIINEQTGERAKNPVTRVLKEGVVVGLANHTALIAKDGTRRSIADSGAPIKNEKGDIIGTVMVFRDITERKRAEEALRQSEEKYRTLFESMREGFALVEVICDKKGKPKDYRFLKINSAFEEQSGMDAKTTEVRTILEIYPDIEPVWIERYGGVALNQRPIHFEDHNHNTKKYYDVIAYSPSKGKCAMLFRDITDRKQVEQEREILIKNLELKNTEMERFIYTISHDLKSPLITIKGFTSLLEQELAKEKKQDAVPDALGYINAAVEKMHLLLEDMLELSRVGHLIKQVEDFALGQVVDEVVELLYGPISERKVKVVIDPNLPTVSADRARIFQVMQNFIENGVKFMGEQKSPRITIGSRVEGGEQVIYVRDNGIGIDPAHHNRIFDLFQQLDPSHEGSGVGLTLVKRIIESHGGRIWVESEGVGKGTAFCFTLPRQEAS